LKRVPEFQASQYEAGLDRMPIMPIYFAETNIDIGISINIGNLDIGMGNAIYWVFQYQLLVR
jgi:hypothetical protein